MSKIWMISDTHFGVKNNSKKWEELSRKWIYEFFLPLIDKEKTESDILIHLGDVFDNRQSVCLSTMSIAIEFFEQVSKRFKQIIVLCGNHDAYYTNNNNVTSIECLKYIPNVRIIKEPTNDVIFGKKTAFVPWTENPNVFKNIDNVDLLFCHAEFNGCTMNSSGIKSEHGLNIPNISKIYSGHIHHKHKHKNLTYIGSPYQLTQNDRNNAKGVWTLDTDTNEENFYFNNISPEFMRLKYESIGDLTLSDFKTMCSNHFVEIETTNYLMSKCNFQKLLSLLQDDETILDLSFVISKDSKKEKHNINKISSCISISEMLDTYINEYVTCDVATKKLVKAISKKLVNE